MAGRKLPQIQQLEKWELLEELQEAYPFSISGLLLFAQTIINTLINGSPDLNRMQANILKFLFSGNTYRMIMAQRGQAKTTLAAIYCVFLLIHFPHYRIIVFSQNSKRAKEISGWIVKIFYSMEILEFMLPDVYAGDRASIEAFEVHWCLRGSDKSPSVACYSIESGAQGARADVILADDIESLQNSRTVGSREWLIETTKEFESINQYGDIIYLGTPQSSESIYNSLPQRGYQVRIWTGRYPTNDEIITYGDRLAPIILKDISKDSTLQSGGGISGKRGQPTCPEMYDEEQLSKKELSQGAAKFNLQFMLSTGLSDEGRHPLKLMNLIVANFNHEKAPVMPIWSASKQTRWNTAPLIGNKVSDKLYFAMNVDYEYRKFDNIIMGVDPSGGTQHADEMAYCIVGQLGSTLYILSAGGVRGGYAEEDLLKLVFTAKAYGVQSVYVEENFGSGAHLSALKPLFQREHPKCHIEGVTVSGQKELRIIDIVEPLLSSHRLVISQDAILKDIEGIQHYPSAQRLRYSFCYQLSFITRERGSLAHEDRLDAFAIAMHQVVQNVDYDQAAYEARQKATMEAKHQQIMSNPATYVQYMQNNCNIEAVEVQHTTNNMFSHSHFSGRNKTSSIGHNRFS